MGVMSGLIAHNRDDLEELKRRGDRNYYEFKISKSKTPQRVGPVQVTLNKTDQKKGKYTMTVFVDDRCIEKKDKTAGEPVQFYLKGASRMTPYEIVVFDVGKNDINGYLSTPKEAGAGGGGSQRPRRLRLPRPPQQNRNRLNCTAEKLSPTFCLRLRPCFCVLETRRSTGCQSFLRPGATHFNLGAFFRPPDFARSVSYEGQSPAPSFLSSVSSHPCSFAYSATALQAPLEPAQMPARTAAYLIWRGTPAGDARKTKTPCSGSGTIPISPRCVRPCSKTCPIPPRKMSSKPGLTREEAEEYSSLLENSFVVGYLSKPELKMTVSAVPPKPAEHPERPWNGFFFVYDRTGKESLLSKAVLRMHGQEKATTKNFDN